MKRTILTLAVTMFMAGNVFTSCKSNSDKEEDAIENVQDAEQNLEDVTEDINNDAITKANDEEWQTYKTEANNTISENEKRIADLKKAMKKPGTTFDATYEKNIDALEDRNAALKTKIDNYENNQTDWTSFKREFSSDMKEIGVALKDLTVNNKK
jgi:chromosome segregation ATPase